VAAVTYKSIFVGSVITGNIQYTRAEQRKITVLFSAGISLSVSQ